MPADPWRLHGGAIAAAARSFGIPASAWLDLSTGISPHPYPVPTLPLQTWHCLPDAAAAARLQAVAASYYGAPGPACVLPVAGTQAAIQWLPRILTPVQDVAILAPTYAEHARAWAAAGHRVHTVARVEDIPAACGTLVIVNPNNPDGRVLTAAQVLALAERYCVVVDEAFADVMPEVSVAGHCDRAPLIVLRSVGKFFGLAGLRLGFVIAAPALIAQLTEAQGPWAVSGPALAIGSEALGDAGWTAAARASLARAAGRLDALLAAAGLTVIGGTDLFRLVTDADAHGLFEHLARNGILVRPFTDQPHWLRFGLPGDDAAFARLEAALRSRPAVTLGLLRAVDT
ncbi:MAG: threonine-phosphate decarboxylase CobD [Defluviicoccus sp.]|nr:threonine-phosphate decarboxylase CobD [Defluviicoccus sp.]MDG4592532.1 threonine-phosphate decarboxylase CobD [Defluviicoccus sp.]